MKHLLSTILESASSSLYFIVGGKKDYLVVGSDSGRINILEYNTEKNKWDKVHEEMFGKSGCRRVVPGQYLCVDPKGRALMIGALEKTKLVYVLNRTLSAKFNLCPSKLIVSWLLYPACVPYIKFCL